MVQRGNHAAAAAYLHTACPRGALPPPPGKEQAGAPRVRQPPSAGAPTKRKYSKTQATRVFHRDGFCDRYTGGRLIFPGVLRVLSDLFPAEFPWHPNWKIEAAHHLYWLLAATVDHVVPVTHQGADADANWVTTSMLRNLWKSNRSLEETGWQLVTIDPVQRWDGLTRWFLHYADEHPEVLLRSYVAQWYKAARLAQAVT